MLTYGATPATVGTIPLYNARMPPSVLYIIFIVSHMPGNFFLATPPNAAKEADCMESRVRTISRGYVSVTEVMPAAPPHRSLRKGVKSAPGDGSTNFKYNNQLLRSNDGDERAKSWAYSFIEIITPELYCGIWYNPYTVGAVPSHEPPPAFFPPHLHETLSHR